MILLALLLCLGTALADGEEFIGMWYANEIEVEGKSMNPAALDMEMSFRINADGTVEAIAADDSVMGAWHMDGESIVLIMDGDPMAFVPQDGNLVAELDGAKLILGREKAEAKTISTEPRTDAAIADYNGTWNATLVEMMGIQVAVNDMDMSMIIVVNNDVAQIIEGEGEESNVVDATVSVVDGVLYLANEMEEGPLALQLMQDGTMVYTQTVEELSMTICFEKAVTE